MRVAGWVMFALLAGALAACGSKEPPKSGIQTGAADARSAKGDATATEVAKESRGKVKCPPKLKSAKRAAGAPVDDVLGVRPGLNYDDAAALVMCSHELLIVTPDMRGRFQIQTFGQAHRWGFGAGFAQPRVNVKKTDRDYRREMQDRAIAAGTNRARPRGQPGQASWYVATMGAPGEERVISLAREEWFEEGRLPTITGVEQALIEKYGAPTMRFGTSPLHHIRWAYDPHGRLITETSPLFRDCQGNSAPEGATNFSPDCGIVVQARIQALRENPDIAESLQVGVIDQANGYEAIQRTEQAFQQIEAQRRARQVQDAQQNAQAPQL